MFKTIMKAQRFKPTMKLTKIDILVSMKLAEFTYVIEITKY